MLTYVGNRYTGDAGHARCKSTDPSPKDARNGDSLFEFDTFTMYYYDEESHSWITKGGVVRGV